MPSYTFDELATMTIVNQHCITAMQAMFMDLMVKLYPERDREELADELEERFTKYVLKFAENDIATRDLIEKVEGFKFDEE